RLIRRPPRSPLFPYTTLFDLAARASGADRPRQVTQLRPVPRLVGEPEAVVLAVGHRKPETLRVALQPEEGVRSIEARGERPGARRRDVHGFASMVLAEAGSRVHP